MLDFDEQLEQQIGLTKPDAFKQIQKGVKIVKNQLKQGKELNSPTDLKFNLSGRYLRDYNEQPFIFIFLSKRLDNLAYRLYDDSYKLSLYAPDDNAVVNTWIPRPYHEWVNGFVEADKQIKDDFKLYEHEVNRLSKTINDKIKDDVHTLQLSGQL